MTQRRTVRRWWITAMGVALLALPVSPAAAAEVAEEPRRSASFDNTVYDVAYQNGVFYVGGSFREAYDRGSTRNRRHVAAVAADTGRLLDWAPSTNGTVTAITVAGDSVYVAGDFTRVNGTARHGLAKLDADSGELDPDFNPRVEGGVATLAAGHGRLYLGGSVASVDGRSRDRLAAVSLDGGDVDSDWAPEVNRTVHDIEVDADRVYIAGMFTELNGSGSYRKLAAVDPDDGDIDTDFDTDLSMRVRDITLGPDGLYVAAGGVGGRVIGLRDDGSVRWAVRGNGDFQAVAALDDVVYFGGHFSGVCDTPRSDAEYDCPDDYDTRHRLAAVDADDGDLLGWSPHANSMVGVHALAVGRSVVAAGGEFTTFDGGAVRQRRFAMFD